MHVTTRTAEMRKQNRIAEHVRSLIKSLIAYPHCLQPSFWSKPRGLLESSLICGFLCSRTVKVAGCHIKSLVLPVYVLLGGFGPSDKQNITWSRTVTMGSSTQTPPVVDRLARRHSMKAFWQEYLACLQAHCISKHW